MNTYTNNSFKGHWPVGTAAVVRANNAEEAAEVLNAELRNRGLRGDVSAAEMEVMPSGAVAIILCDGNY